MDAWRIQSTADFICGRSFTKIAAQFPDDLLQYASVVAVDLQAECKRRGHSIKVFILADTTYNSLSVDEIAAAHISADCVVHYGRASLTKLSRMPAYYVFPSNQLSSIDSIIDLLFQQRLFQDFICTASTDNNRHTQKYVLFFVDQIYLDSLHTLESSIRFKFSEFVLPVDTTLVFPSLTSCSADPVGCSHQCNVEGNTRTVAGYTWNIKDLNYKEVHDEKLLMVWIGPFDASTRHHLLFSASSASWLSIDPNTSETEQGFPIQLQKLLRKRYFLVEKVRQANIVGILVGTLGAAGYNKTVRHLREAAQKAGKKTYTMLMGKPNPAKLANFPEIEVFVLVADPQGQILDSKDYLAPIVTPHEAMLAFKADIQRGDVEWDQKDYTLDFDHIVDTATMESCDEGDMISTLVLQAQQALIVTPSSDSGQVVEIKSAADYLLHKRTWRGVEAPLVGSEEKAAQVAVPGQVGRAAGYIHEKHAQDNKIGN